MSGSWKRLAMLAMTLGVFGTARAEDTASGTGSGSGVGSAASNLATEISANVIRYSTYLAVLTQESATAVKAKVKAKLDEVYPKTQEGNQKLKEFSEGLQRDVKNLATVIATETEKGVEKGREKAKEKAGEAAAEAKEVADGAIGTVSTKLKDFSEIVEQEYKERMAAIKKKTK